MLLDQARQLQQVAKVGGIRPMLGGKNLGLLQGGNDANTARRFCDAARELGAHVAIIPSTFKADSAEGEVRNTARMLGRLYDAVECQGLPPSIVKQLADTSGIPVFD
jgi:ornithine carbamoyltransferase